MIESEMVVVCDRAAQPLVAVACRRFAVARWALTPILSRQVASRRGNHRLVLDSSSTATTRFVYSSLGLSLLENRNLENLGLDWFAE